MSINDTSLNTVEQFTYLGSIISNDATFIQKLGAEVCWQFVDVYGTDEELLGMIPRPVIAVMLLYPLTDKAKGTKIGDVDSESLNTSFFMRQTIGNACGTVALVHALANNEEHVTFSDDKYFRTFLNATKGMNPEERGKYLEQDEGMGHVHEEFAQEGDTQAPSRDASVMPHFVAFVHKDGKLLEMDGRNTAPVCHGKTSPDTLLEDAARVVKTFIQRDPEEINFNLMALTKAN
ncbi:hypothetical protein ACOMHN_038415 [Nucella lapillus]